MTDHISIKRDRIYAKPDQPDHYKIHVDCGTERLSAIPWSEPLAKDKLEAPWCQIKIVIPAACTGEDRTTLLGALSNCCPEIGHTQKPAEAGTGEMIVRMSPPGKQTYDRAIAAIDKLLTGNGFIETNLGTEAGVSR